MQKLFQNLTNHCMYMKNKKQFCGYCPEDKCLLDCKICNPKIDEGNNCNC